MAAVGVGPTSMTISRSYNFSAAHQIEGHPKCGRIHGHNYEVIVTLTGSLIDGMVLDYGLLDIVMKPIIEEADHRYLVSQDNLIKDNPYAMQAVEKGTDACDWGIVFSTAECISRHIGLRLIKDLIDIRHVEVVSVEVKETPRSGATYYA